MPQIFIEHHIFHKHHQKSLIDPGTATIIAAIINPLAKAAYESANRAYIKHKHQRQTTDKVFAALHKDVQAKHEFAFDMASKIYELAQSSSDSKQYAENLAAIYETYNKRRQTALSLQVWRRHKKNINNIKAKKDNAKKLALIKYFGKVESSQRDTHHELEQALKKLKQAIEVSSKTLSPMRKADRFEQLIEDYATCLTNALIGFIALFNEADAVLQNFD